MANDIKGSKLHHSYLHPDPTSSLWSMDANISNIHLPRCSFWTWIHHHFFSRRAQLLPSIQSWDTSAWWPLGVMLWPSCLEICQIHSMNPNFCHSVCWCSSVSGSPFFLSTTALKGRSWWLWKYSLSWLPAQHSLPSYLVPSVTLSCWDQTRIHLIISGRKHPLERRIFLKYSWKKEFSFYFNNFMNGIIHISF